MKNKYSKRFKKILDLSKDKKIEIFDDAIKKIKTNCTTKFDESIDVSLKLNLKQKKDEVGIRTNVNLPNGNGKKVKVAVLCEESKVNEAKEAGCTGAQSSLQVAPLIVPWLPLPLKSVKVEPSPSLKFQ